MNQKEQEQTAKALALMFHCFPQSAIADVDVQMEAYMFAIDEFEHRDIEAAIKRIMQGGEGHEKRAFVPSTAELCEEIRNRKHMREIMAKREARLELVKS